MQGKTYIFKATRNWGGGKDKVVDKLTGAFAKVIIEQMEAKPKEMFIQAIRSMFRDNEVNIKFTAAFDAFLENNNSHFGIEDVENVVKQRDEAVLAMSQLRLLWDNFITSYRAINVSGEGVRLEVIQESMRAISLILKDNKDS